MAMYDVALPHTSRYWHGVLALLVHHQVLAVSSTVLYLGFGSSNLISLDLFIYDDCVVACRVS